MGGIQVVLIGYTNLKVLKQALISLNFISKKIQKVILLKENTSFSYQSSACYFSEVTHENLVNEDLGETLNKLVEVSSAEYTLFLYDGQYFSIDIKNLLLELENGKHVVTYDDNDFGLNFKKIFMVRNTFLKQTKLLSKYQVPFKEAVLPAWLSQIRQSNIINMPCEFINREHRKHSIDQLEKNKFIKKYFCTDTISSQGSSIAIMIANYNMADYVDIAINSCYLQNGTFDQICVIDDGSTDNSYEQLEKWKNQSNFQLLRSVNEGKASALNKVIPHINTEFVMELDADDWLDPNAFSVISNNITSLPKEVSVLYGNLKTWKQTREGHIHFGRLKKGKQVDNKRELLSYKFPLGPRIYRTSSLKEVNGFPIFEFEDVAILNNIIKKNLLLYQDFSVYNVREHKLSFTRKEKKNHSKWSDFKRYFD
ncbi:glycosyltransferase family 2 protein [Priestia sp. RMT2NF4]|uniref:glycosyltransferase family 2 protein n=1 Tax=Priestia sp. RMT2NF4 TaxID=3398394 RepID=UPI003A4C5306